MQAVCGVLFLRVEFTEVDLRQKHGDSSGPVTRVAPGGD